MELNGASLNAAPLNSWLVSGPVDRVFDPSGGAVFAGNSYSYKPRDLVDFVPDGGTSLFSGDGRVQAPWVKGWWDEPAGGLLCDGGLTEVVRTKVFEPAAPHPTPGAVSYLYPSGAGNPAYVWTYDLGARYPINYFYNYFSGANTKIVAIYTSDNGEGWIERSYIDVGGNTDSVSVNIPQVAGYPFDARWLKAVMYPRTPGNTASCYLYVYYLTFLRFAGSAVCSYHRALYSYIPSTAFGGSFERYPPTGTYYSFKGYGYEPTGGITASGLAWTFRPHDLRSYVGVGGFSSNRTASAAICILIEVFPYVASGGIQSGMAASTRYKAVTDPEIYVWYGGDMEPGQLFTTCEFGGWAYTEVSNVYLPEGGIISAGEAETRCTVLVVEPTGGLVLRSLTWSYVPHDIAEYVPTGLPPLTAGLWSYCFYESGVKQYRPTGGIEATSMTLVVFVRQLIPTGGLVARGAGGTLWKAHKMFLAEGAEGIYSDGSAVTSYRKAVYEYVSEGVALVRQGTLGEWDVYGHGGLKVSAPKGGYGYGGGGVLRNGGP